MAKLIEQLQTANRKLQLIAWQGFQLTVPDTWNPVKVQGDWNEGTILIADMLQAKLGLRWKRMKRGDPEKWAGQALKAEVGSLAASEAKAIEMPAGSDWAVSKLYLDPDPPGRDVWVGWSRSSGRGLEVVHHTKVRDRVLADDVLPSLSDTAATDEQAWSIFDLSCRTPAGWELQWYRLNAGDLTLAFRKKGRTALIRQIAPATLALARRPIDAWMAELPKGLKKVYRPLTDVAEGTIEIGERSLSGRQGAFRRRRRFSWAWFIARRQYVVGGHDEQRNRLMIAQGDDEAALRTILKTAGWARGVAGEPRLADKKAEVRE